MALLAAWELMMGLEPPLDRWRACVPVLTRTSCWVIKIRFLFRDGPLQNLTPRLEASASAFHCQSNLSSNKRSGKKHFSRQ